MRMNHCIASSQDFRIHEYEHKIGQKARISFPGVSLWARLGPFKSFSIICYSICDQYSFLIVQLVFSSSNSESKFFTTNILSCLIFQSKEAQIFMEHSLHSQYITYFNKYLTDMKVYICYLNYFTKCYNIVIFIPLFINLKKNCYSVLDIQANQIYYCICILSFVKLNNIWNLVFIFKNISQTPCCVTNHCKHKIIL